MMQRIVVNGLSKKFKIGFYKNQTALARILSAFSGKEPKRLLHALKDVSFSVNKGEIVGMIGRNGSGKSTLLRIIAGIYEHDEGKVMVNGNIISLIGLSIGLQLRLTLKDNIFLVCSLFGLTRKTIIERFDSIVSFADLGNFINTKLYQVSSGMSQRLAFSVAIHCNPDILLLDEVFEVGDKDFRRISAEKIKEMAREGLTVLLVSHELWLIERHCDRVVWLEDGKIIRAGSTKDVLEEYIEAS